MIRQLSLLILSAIADRESQRRTNDLCLRRKIESASFYFSKTCIMSCVRTW